MHAYMLLRVIALIPNHIIALENGGNCFCAMSLDGRCTVAPEDLVSGFGFTEGGTLPMKIERDGSTFWGIWEDWGMSAQSCAEYLVERAQDIHSPICTAHGSLLVDQPNVVGQLAAQLLGV